MGVAYGRGINSIAAQLNTTKEEAQKIYDNVMQTFSGLEKLKLESENMAKTKGFVTTIWGRKRRLPDMQLPDYNISYTKAYSDATGLTDVPETTSKYYLDLLSKCKWKSEKDAIKSQANLDGIHIRDNGAFKSRAQRQCVNSRIQGSAADMTKLAMCKIAKDPILKKLGFRMLIQVHDEIIGECPEENVKEASERFAYVMSHAAEDKIPIPFSSDVAIEHHWSLGD